MALPGIVFYYYGQEIGMQDGILFEKQITDFTGYSRDCIRLPMQWDDSVSAGKFHICRDYSSFVADFMD